MSNQPLDKKHLPPPPAQVLLAGQLREIKQELSDLKQVVKELNDKLNLSTSTPIGANSESTKSDSPPDKIPGKPGSLSGGQVLTIGVILFFIYFICSNLYQAVNTPLIRASNDSARQAAQAACESDQALNRSQGIPDSRDCTNP